MADGSCYFPAAFQGEFVTQTLTPSPSPPPPTTSPSQQQTPTISYSSLAVTFDSIPVWGSCHKRNGNNVVLVDDTGGLTCYRCFKLVLRSPNVVQAHTSALGRCYATAERAEADCPMDRDIREGRVEEIMLYRK